MPAIQESEFIWFDGALVPWNQAQIHVLSHVAHYGSGVFEGIRAYSSPRGLGILGLGAHVQRFFQSAKVIELDLDYTEEAIAAAIVETVHANKMNACYIRPLAFRGYGALGVLPTTCPVQVAIACFPWGTLHGSGAIEEGVDVGVSSWRRMAPDTHPAMAKAVGNYLNSQMIVLEAKRHGYAEGIVLDAYGYVCEGSGENLFLAFDGVLWTPPAGESILSGITRGFVMQLARDLGIEVQERRIAREMLYTADEFFMTGTAAEITPVKSVDRIPVGTGSRGPITARLQQEFFGIVQGELEDRHAWLTPVDPEDLS